MGWSERLRVRAPRTLARAGRIAAAGLGAAIVAAPATAATLGLTGGGSSAVITAADKHADPDLGLRLDRAAEVAFTFLSGDSGSWNKLAEVTGRWNGLFRSDETAAGTTGAPVLMDAGLLRFKLNTRGMRRGYSNHYHWTTRGDGVAVRLEILDGGRSALIAYDDGLGAAGFDDLVARVDVASAPLPGAAWLLLGSFGGLGIVVSRRRRTA